MTIGTHGRRIAAPTERHESGLDNLSLTEKNDDKHSNRILHRIG